LNNVLKKGYTTRVRFAFLSRELKWKCKKGSAVKFVSARGVCINNESNIASDYGLKKKKRRI
jgi:hypothetical protein